MPLINTYQKFIYFYLWRCRQVYMLCLQRKAKLIFSREIRRKRYTMKEKNLSDSIKKGPERNRVYPTISGCWPRSARATKEKAKMYTWIYAHRKRPSSFITGPEIIFLLSLSVKFCDYVFSRFNFICRGGQYISPLFTNSENQAQIFCFVNSVWYSFYKRFKFEIFWIHLFQMQSCIGKEEVCPISLKSNAKDSGWGLWSPCDFPGDRKCRSNLVHPAHILREIIYFEQGNPLFIILICYS